MKVYAKKITRQQAEQVTNPIIYIGRNPTTDKKIIVLSGGHLDTSKGFEVHSSINSRHLFDLYRVTNIAILIKASAYYIAQ